MNNQMNRGFSAPARRNVVLGLAAAASLAAMANTGRAASVTLTSTDTQGNTSFTTGTRWSDGQVPSTANDYLVPGSLILRTPSDGGSVTFGGNSLTVGDNGSTAAQLSFKTLTGSVITINNLTLNKGSVINGGTSAAAATTDTLTSNAITVGAGGATFDSGAAGRMINVNAPISGSGPITVASAGATTFLLANSYTGTTTVTGGALNAADGVSLPTASALALNGGVLGTSGTFSRGLGAGAGQVTISGVGGFNAVGGDLVVALGGAAAPTPLTVGANGFTPGLMVLNYSSATNSVDFRNNVDLAGATTFGVSSNSGTIANSAIFSGSISDSVGGGVFTKAGSGLLTLTGTNTYAGRTAVNVGILRGTDGVSLPVTSNISFNGGLLSTTNTFTRSLGTGAGQVQWISGGNGGFAAVGNDLTVALGGTDAPTPLVWGVTASFNPATLILGGRIGTNTVTFTNAIDLATATATTRTITSFGGVNVITGVISNSGAAAGILGIEGDGTATGGTIVLAAANTYGGTTLIDTGTAGSGTVRATNSQSFGTSLVQFNPPGAASTARLEVTNNITMANNISLSGRANTSVAIENLSGNNTLAGTITFTTGGGNYIVQSDSGTLTLSGASGSTAGTAVTSTASSARTLTLQGDGNGVVSGIIANGAATMQLTKAGNGTWTLTGANTFTGPTAVNGGTLQLGNGAIGNDGTIASTSGVTVAAGATLAFNRAGISNADYVISGDGAVLKAGAGTQTLNGSNTYTGTTAVSAGTLKMTNPAYSNVLANAGGVDIGNGGGKLVLDYTNASSPVAQVKTILDNGYATNFAGGQFRSSSLSAGHTVGYRDDGSTVTVMVTLPGDANLDGVVNFNDFLLLQAAFGNTGTRFDQGNFNYDNATNFNDFLLLQANFGQSISGATVLVTAQEVAALQAFAASVPEPASLAAIGVVGVLVGRRRGVRDKRL